MLLYRVIVSVLALPLAAAALWRVLRRREDLAALRGRLGLAPLPAVRRPTVWLHAASLGELASVRPLVLGLRAARPDLRWLVTANTAAGRDLARRWGLSAETAPLDLRAPVRRLVAGWDVRLHLTAESELWPNRVAVCAARGVPVAAIGARLTRRTARGWTRLPGLAPRVLGALALVSPQDAGSRRRLAALGAAPARLGPVLDLKAFYVPPEAPAPDAALAARFPRARTWLAASTHPGEEEAVIAAHLSAAARQPDLRLILAPRHPARAEEVAALLRGAGLEFDRRSRGEDTGAAVLLADTLGEMALWYRLAGRVLVGGSLVPRGGHTPYEPAAFGCAVLHGPHLENFRAAYARLRRAAASRQVADAADLARGLEELADPAAQARAGAAGAAALRPRERLERLVRDLAALVPPPAAQGEDPASGPRAGRAG